MAAILEALSEDLQQRDYREWQRFALVAAVVAQAAGAKVKLEDFIGPPPGKGQRGVRDNDGLEALVAEAKAKGLVGPWR